MDKLMSELKDPQQSMLTSQTNIWHTYALSMTKDLCALVADRNDCDMSSGGGRNS